MYGSFAFTHETTIYSITYLAQKAKYFPNFIMQEISLCDVSEISTKAPCEVALIGERHVRIEIAGFVMRTFAQPNSKRAKSIRKLLGKGFCGRDFSGY